MKAPPLCTRRLMIATVLVYIAQTVVSPRVLWFFALWPFGHGFLPWQLVSYGFLHASLLHLAVNVFGLYMFGSALERVFGSRRFLVYYLSCIIAGGLLHLVASYVAGEAHPSVGASGGVFGLLLGVAVLFPKAIIMLVFPPVPLPAWLFATLYAGLELFLGITGAQSGVAHFVHLGGMLGGWLLISYWRGQRR